MNRYKNIFLLTLALIMSFLCISPSVVEAANRPNDKQHVIILDEKLAELNFDDGSVDTLLGLQRVSARKYMTRDYAGKGDGVGTIRVPIGQKDYVPIGYAEYAVKVSYTSNGYPLLMFRMDDNVIIESANDAVVNVREHQNGSTIIQCRSTGEARLNIVAPDGTHYFIKWVIS